jgi:hypothetical protein
MIFDAIGELERNITHFALENGTKSLEISDNH